MSRRPPPPLLDPLTAADRAADAWLAAQGESPWDWPRMQGAQPRGGAGDDDDGHLDVQTAKLALGQPVRDPVREAAEAAQTLAALRAGGLIDAAGRRTDAAAPPASCGDASDDAPALPVAAVAAAYGRCLRTVQAKARRRCDVEAAGQLVLECVPPAAEVYKARASRRLVTP